MHDLPPGLAFQGMTAQTQMRQVVVRGQPVELPMPGMSQVAVRRRPVAAREPAGQVKLGRPSRDLPGLIRINRPPPLQKHRIVAQTHQGQHRDGHGHRTDF